MTNIQSYWWERNSGSRSVERAGLITGNIQNRKLLWKTQPVTKRGLGCKGRSQGMCVMNMPTSVQYFFGHFYRVAHELWVRKSKSRILSCKTKPRWCNNLKFHWLLSIWKYFWVLSRSLIFTRFCTLTVSYSSVLDSPNFPVTAVSKTYLIYLLL